MIYHTPEEFAMRKNDYSDPHLGAWRAYYKALFRAGVYVGATLLKRRRRERPYALRRESAACRMGPCGRRSNWQIIILELPSIDAALEWARVSGASIAQWKSGRWRLRPCAGVHR